MDDVLTQALSELLEKCIQMDFETPLNVVAIAANGAAIVMQYVEANDGSCLEAAPLIESNDRSFAPPVNIFISDSRGEVLRMLIERDGKRGPIRHLVY